MSKYTKYANQLNIFAEYFDSTGNHESANECVVLLHKLAEYQKKEIRLASTREANIFKQIERGFRKTIIDPIKNLAHKIDQTVRQIPGGWVTVIGAATYFGAFDKIAGGKGPAAQLAKSLKNFFGSAKVPKVDAAGKVMTDAAGKTIMESRPGQLMDLLNSKNPMFQQAGQALLKQVQSGKTSVPGGVSTQGYVPPTSQTAMPTGLASEMNSLVSNSKQSLLNITDLSKRKTTFTTNVMPQIENLVRKYSSYPSISVLRQQMIDDIRRNTNV